VKYLSLIDTCSVTIPVLYFDIAPVSHFPSFALARLFNVSHAFILNLLDTEEIAEIYRELQEIITVTEEEKETIEAAANAAVRALVIDEQSIKNKELYRYAQSVISVFLQYSDEHGLLRGLDWKSLRFWDFIIAATTQRIAVEYVNEKNKSGMR